MPNVKGFETPFDDYVCPVPGAGESDGGSFGDALPGGKPRTENSSGIGEVQFVSIEDGQSGKRTYKKLPGGGSY